MVVARQPRVHSQSKELPSKELMKNASWRQSRDESPELDAVCLRIIDELTTDGRVSLAELGRRVNLSTPTVGERVRRLEQASVITGYRAEIDPMAFGYRLTARSSASTSPPRNCAESPNPQSSRHRSANVTASPARTAPTSSPTHARSTNSPRARPVPRLRPDHNLSHQ